MNFFQKLFAFFMAFFVSNKILVTAPISNPTPTPIPIYQVLKVIDGDTFVVKMATTEAKVRLLGIDTPEIATGQCMAIEAKKKLEELIGGKQIYLNPSIGSPDKDKYDRFLRNATVDNKDVSTQLVAAGLANLWKSDNRLIDALKQAKEKKLGLWSPNACKPTGFCNNVPVLMYHHIQPLAEAKTQGHAPLTVDSDWFEKQVKYLSVHGYQFINVAQLITAINSGQTLDKSVAITIDDAYSDTFNYAYPILQKYGARASLFVPTGLVQNPKYLTWDQISQMYRDNIVFPYNHTWSHFSLPSEDIDKERTEITTAQAQLEEHLGPIPKIIAYPYGGYNAPTIKLLQELGFSAAFSTKPGTWQCTGNIFYLPRLRIGNYPLSVYGL